MMHYAIKLFSSATCYKIKVSELLCSCNGCVFTSSKALTIVRISPFVSVEADGGGGH